MNSWFRLAQVIAVALAGLVGGGLSPALAGQPAVTVSGRVVDSSGAVVPGVVVTARRVPDTVVASSASDASGRFVLQLAYAGDYTVTAELAGFQPAVVRVATSAATVVVDLLLRPTTLAEALTVIGTRLAGSEEGKRRLPGALDLLTRETLESAHVFSTSEALRKVPGIIVRDEEGLGLRPNIGVRGLNPTRSSKVLLLEDGVPVAFAPYGDNASYYHPPIERFDRIEVLKGSSQIAYGPVTLGGVINYITPEAPAQTQVMVAAAGGNVHAGLVDVMGKVNRFFGPTQQLAVKANYYGERSQVTYSGLREAEYRAAARQNPFGDDRFSGDRAAANAGYRALLWSRVAITGSAYVSHFARDWWRQSSNSGQRPNDAADPQCGGMANLRTTCGNEGRLRQYRHVGAEVRGRHDFVAGARHEIDFGLRVHAEHQDRRQLNGDTPTARTGDLVESNVRTTGAGSAFLQHRWLVKDWTITPGMRVEQIDYSRTNRLLAVRGQAATTEVVPGVAVSWGPVPDATLFAGLHRGFGPARAEDVVNNTTGGTVDLDPERSWNSELGGRLRA